MRTGPLRALMLASAVLVTMLMLFKTLSLWGYFWFLINYWNKQGLYNYYLCPQFHFRMPEDTARKEEKLAESQACVCGHFSKKSPSHWECFHFKDLISDYKKMKKMVKLWGDDHFGLSHPQSKHLTGKRCVVTLRVSVNSPSKPIWQIKWKPKAVILSCCWANPHMDVWLSNLGAQRTIQTFDCTAHGSA